MGLGPCFFSISVIWTQPRRSLEIDSFLRVITAGKSFVVVIFYDKCLLVGDVEKERGACECASVLVRECVSVC